MFWKTQKLTDFMRARNAHMNAEMERRGSELPDAFDLIPPNVGSLPKDFQRAIDIEVWAVTGANIGYMNDMARARRRKEEAGLAGDGWEQDELPLEWPEPLMIAESQGWCAPSPYTYGMIVIPDAS